MHFHCVVLDGVVESNAGCNALFHAATGIDEQAIATGQAGVRRRLLRYYARPPFALERLQ